MSNLRNSLRKMSRHIAWTVVLAALTTLPCLGDPPSRQPWTQMDAGRVEKGKIVWTWDADKLSIGGDVDLVKDGGFKSFLLSDSVGAPDLTLRCILQHDEKIVDDYGIVCHFQDERNYNSIVFTGRETIELWRVTNGQTQVLASVVERAPIGIPNHVDVSLVGTTIVFRMNGQELLKAADGFFRGGKAGLFVTKALPLKFQGLNIYPRGTEPVVTIPLYIVKKPYPLWVVGDEAILMWEANRPVDAEVCYGTKAGQLTSKVKVGAKTCVSKATLPGLAGNTRYWYRVTSGSQVIGEGSFQTDVGPDRPFTVGLVSDSHSLQRDKYIKISTLMADRKPDLVVHAGDLVRQGNHDDDWDLYYFHPSEKLLSLTPIYSAIGNHDQTEGRKLVERFLPFPGIPAPKAGEFPLRYYAFTYGNASFIFLDGVVWGCYSESCRQMVWLKETLASPAFQKAQWKFVITHPPAYTVGWEDWTEAGDLGLRNNVWPILEKYKVDMVITGHTHSYERGLANGIYHIITGGVGGYENFGRNLLNVQRFALMPQYCVMKINGPRLEFVCRDEADQEFDRFVIEKGQPRTIPSAPVFSKPPVDGPVGEQVMGVSYKGMGRGQVHYRVGIKERPSADGFWEPTKELYDVGKDVELKVNFKVPGAYHVIVQALDEMLRPSEWVESAEVTIRPPQK